MGKHFTQAELNRALTNQQNGLMQRLYVLGVSKQIIASAFRTKRRTITRHDQQAQLNHGVVPLVEFEPRKATKADLIKEAITEIKRTKGSFTPEEVQDYIALHHPTQVPSLNYIRLVAKQLDQTNKIVSGVSNADDPVINQRRMPALLRLRQLLLTYRLNRQNNVQMDLVFADESRGDKGRLAHQCKRWGTVGQRVYVLNSKEVRGPSTNIISFRSVHLWSCEYYSNKNLTARKFTKMVKEVLQWKRNYGIEHVVLVLDNARVHSQNDLEALKQTYPNFVYCFLPLYAPDLNICEFFFSQLKALIKKHSFLMPQLNSDRWRAKVQSLANNVLFNATTAVKHVLSMCEAMIQCNGSLLLAAKLRNDLKFRNTKRRFRYKMLRYRR